MNRWRTGYPEHHGTILYTIVVRKETLDRRILLLQSFAKDAAKTRNVAWKTVKRLIAADSLEYYRVTWYLP